MHRLESVQALRGIAVFFVVLSHVGFINFGAFGVDLFFCISGFIMMYITQRTTANFFYKRVIRIIPLYWVFTISTFILVSCKPSLLNSTSSELSHLIKSIAFIPFDKNGLVEPLLGPGWTLNYEMYFYLIFFVSLKISFEYRGYMVSGIFGILALAGFFHEGGVIWEFYTDPIILEFSFGILAFYILNSKVKFNETTSIFVIFLVLFICIFTRIKPSPDLRFLIWGVPMFLFFLLFVTNDYHFFVRGLLEKIGNASYSIYLTHLFVILGFDRLLSPMQSLSLSSLLLSLIAITSSIILGYFVYKWFEVPVHRYLAKRVKN